MTTYIISLSSTDELLCDGAALWQVDDDELPFVVCSQFMTQDGLLFVSIHNVIRRILLFHLGDGDHLSVLLPLLTRGVDVNCDDPPCIAEYRLPVHVSNTPTIAIRKAYTLQHQTSLHPVTSYSRNKSANYCGLYKPQRDILLALCGALKHFHQVLVGSI